MNGAPSLRELQRRFFIAIAAEPGGDAAASEAVDHIGRSTTQSAAERLQVYVDAYYWRLVEVMRETFPKVAACLDSDAFDQLVRVYLQEHPSRHPSVSYVGSAWPDFLDECGNLPGWAADLARLEWARAQVFEAADSPPVDLAMLQPLTAAHLLALRFQPIAACTVLESRWPLDEVWRDPTVPVVPRRTTLRLWRGRDQLVRHSVMATHEQAAWQRMTRGESWAEICSAFDDLPEAEAAAAAGGTLRRWFDAGVLRLDGGQRGGGWG